MRAWMPAVLALLTVAFGAVREALVQRAPAAYAARSNPLSPDDRNRMAGAKLYDHECAACHGRERQGIGHAPPLSRPEIWTASPGAIFWVLRNGSLVHGMPSFASLPELERWQIIVFLQSVGNR